MRFTTAKPNLPSPASETPRYGHDESTYDIHAFGTDGWSSLNFVNTGGDPVTLQYEGPLDPGMYYQFRVTSWRQLAGKDAAPISATEDLRGVFFKPVD